MRELHLNGAWELIERPLGDGPEAAAAVLAAAPTLAATVPGDVNDALVRAGRLPEPLIARQYEAFAEVPERSWWYRRELEVPADWQACGAVELWLDGLDVHADIWFNGAWLGHQASAFHPFVGDVTGLLRPGAANSILVRLTTGRERVPDDARARALQAAVPTEAGRGYPERGFGGRIYLRKPAYVWGWDWNPPLPTCGITGEVRLRGHGPLEISDLALRTRLGDDGAARVTATIEVELGSVLGSAWASACLTLTDEAGAEVASRRDNIGLAAGRNYGTLSIELAAPRLWWPNGSGAPHRYTVTAKVRTDGATATRSLPYGLRTVAMIDRPGHFAFRINGTELFIKGGNWVPADALYGRVTDAKLGHLVDEAAAANFNCLRVWGGGRFPPEAFYEACDRRGILLWHDFMSACAPLPAHEEWFHRSFMAEADYQVRRSRHRACMLLWCGNNEVLQMYPGRHLDNHSDPGWRLYHRDLPRLVHELAPDLPYRPTSPFGGADSVHDPRTGDCHHWIVMSPKPENWSWPEYWDAAEVPIFNSEYGYGGPCCLATTRQYLGTDRPDLLDDTARKHTNTFYDIPRVLHGIATHYRDPEGIGLTDYILLGGLCQGLNLGYSLESLRANDHSMGGIHWMYNDSWGENGWSIIDHYLRRKISFYNVARCLAPRRLVLRQGGQAFGGAPDEVVLIALNDSPEPLVGTVDLGYLSYDGSTRRLQSIRLNVPPHGKCRVGSCPLPTAAARRHGTVAAIPTDAALAPVTWRHGAMRDARLPAARPEVTGVELAGEDLLVTVASAHFAHAVYLNAPDHARLSDHYFDLLPGAQRTIRIDHAADLAATAWLARCVNQAD